MTKLENTTNAIHQGDMPPVILLHEIITRQVAIRPDKVALHFEGASLTYREIDEGSSKAARGLQSLNVKPDERVAYLGKNSHVYYELLFGVAKAGAVICPINWRLALPEILYVLNDCKPKVLFIGIEFLDLIPDLLAGAASIENIIPMEPAEGLGASYEQWRDECQPIAKIVMRDTLDDAIQMYTSGTTGHPKGAVLSNRSILTAYQRYREQPSPEYNIWYESDVSLIPMPVFHVGGTAWGLTTMGNGATGVVLRNFVPTEVLGYIDKFKISKLFLVPAAIQIVVNQPNARDIDYSQLKYIFYGASPMPLPLLEKAIDVFGCGFAQFYGMTETSGSITALPPEDHDINGNERMKSVGKALLGVEIAIWDENETPLGQGEIGEIVTQSTMNMNGYWNKAEATNETITQQGWLKTGDLGLLDPDGYLFLKDRKKDMIISGGENVYPAEVENVLYGHPMIEEAAVIGIPDEKWGEVVKACIVLKDGKMIEQDELIKWTRERLAGFKCPKTIVYLEELPRNPSGKVLRRKLRD